MSLRPPPTRQTGARSLTQTHAFERLQSSLRGRAVPWTREIVKLGGVWRKGEGVVGWSSSEEEEEEEGQEDQEDQEDQEEEDQVEGSEEGEEEEEEGGEEGEEKQEKEDGGSKGNNESGNGMEQGHGVKRQHQHSDQKEPPHKKVHHDSGIEIHKQQDDDDKNDTDEPGEEKNEDGLEDGEERPAPGENEFDDIMLTQARALHKENVNKELKAQHANEEAHIHDTQKKSPVSDQPKVTTSMSEPHGHQPSAPPPQ